MNRTANFLKAGSIGVLASLIYLFILKPFPLLEVPNLKFQDLFFRLRHQIPRENLLKARALLVTVDDESVKKMQTRWPFNRRVYAEVLKKIEDAHPALIAFDFVFSGKSDPIDDFILAESFRKAGHVTIASFVDQDGILIASRSEIAEAAKASGVVNKALDKDLYVRSAYLSFQDAGGNLVSWPWEIEIAAQLLNTERDRIQMTSEGLRLGEILIPYSDQKKVRINYRMRLNEIDQISFWNAYEEGIPKEAIDGKMLIFAATSHLLHDYYHTPFGLMPGIMINVNLLANFLEGDFIKTIPLFWNAPLFFLVLFLSAFASLRYDILKSLLLFAVLIASVVGIFFLLFLNNYVTDGFTYLLSAAFVFLTVTFYRYFRTFLENLGLQKKVVTDPLTGLYNRRALEQHLDSALEQIANAKGVRKTDPFHEVSVLMIDVDDFKKVNDTHGHQFGDDVLKNVSFAIKENTRASDLAARYGGEEFCVVLGHTTKEEAREIAEKIRRAVETNPMSYVNQMMRFTISLGVASAKSDNLPSSRALIRAADQALYTAKRAGKNKVCVYH